MFERCWRKRKGTCLTRGRSGTDRRARCIARGRAMLLRLRCRRIGHCSLRRRPHRRHCTQTGRAAHRQKAVRTTVTTISTVTRSVTVPPVWPRYKRWRQACRAPGTRSGRRRRRHRSSVSTAAINSSGRPRPRSAVSDLRQLSACPARRQTRTTVVRRTVRPLRRFRHPRAPLSRSVPVRQASAGRLGCIIVRIPKLTPSTSWWSITALFALRTPNRPRCSAVIWSGTPYARPVPCSGHSDASTATGPATTRTQLNTVRFSTPTTVKPVG